MSPTLKKTFLTMLPLRIFLYIICFLCLSWGAAIFAGPTFLKSFIKSYSNGQLNAYSITVTPKLNVVIGRLEYTKMDASGSSYLDGFARSVKVFWSIFSDEPFITVQAGPSLLSDIFIADSLTFSTPSFSELDFQEIVINADVRNLEMPSSFYSGSLQMQAIFDRDKNKLRELSLGFKSAGTEALGSWVADELYASIDEINFNFPIEEQAILINLSADKSTAIRDKLDLSGLEVFFTISGGEIEFQISSGDFKYTAHDLIHGSINAQGIYDQSGFLKKAHLNFPNVSIWSGTSERSDISLEIMGTESAGYEIRVVAETSPLELSVNDNFIGTLPASNLSANLFSKNDGSELYGETGFKFINEGASEITGNADLSVILDNSTNIFSCLILDCEISAFETASNLNFDQEWISITSRCISSPCNFSKLSYILKTSNTAEIFYKINGSKIISPLHTFYFFALINEGKKVGDGHEVYIN